MGEGRACSNLGIVYQLLGDNDAALKLHQAHLSIARILQDKAGMGRAYGNIGNAYSDLGFYEQVCKNHKILCAINILCLFLVSSNFISFFCFRQ